MRDEANKDFWQRTAKLYGPAMKQSDHLYEAVSDRIRPHLDRNMNVLELACGTGQLSFRLSGQVRLWEATDFSPAMIAEAKKGIGSRRLHFSVQDATALPYEAGTFDAVVIANALHIMPRPDRALSEIRRVLKPGGLLFAPTFVRGRGLRYRLWSGAMGLTGFRVFHRWNGGELTDFIAGQGFSVTEQQVLDGVPPLCYVAGIRNSRADTCP